MLGALALISGLATGASVASAAEPAGVTQVATLPEASGQGQSLNSRFRGVNWADPRDNFIQDNNVPSGLSAADDYATTYRKSTQILGQFKTLLHANTVRLGINHATVSGAWWQSYRAIVDAATALDMNVILSVWPDRTFRLVEPNANVYLDLVNEPQGYNDDPSGWVGGNATNWRDVAAGWLEHFPAFPRSRVIIAGTGPGGDWYLGSVGNDHRLDGTLLELHVYSAFGLSFTTYQDWKNWFRGQIAGFQSRTIVGEFGTRLNGGVDFNGPRDGSNPVSYLYAVTDTIRELGLGTVFWPGFRQRDAWNMLAFTGDGTDADPYVGHIVNPSAYDRLQWAYGLGTPAPTAIPSSAGDAPLVARTGTISGKVVDASTGQPVAGAELLVYAPPYFQSAQGPKDFAYTGADGTFQVTNVAPGTYIVQLRDPRYEPQWFDGTADPRAARTVTVTAGHDTAGANYVATPVK
jgi:hypothetical protein